MSRLCVNSIVISSGLPRSVGLGLIAQNLCICDIALATSLEPAYPFFVGHHICGNPMTTKAICGPHVWAAASYHAPQAIPLAVGAAANLSQPSEYLEVFK